MPEILLKLTLAIVCGGIIGFEREYSSKAAGFRTITMITLGSTLFTILSFKVGAAINQNYIAGNIITGIGFIGAGVIFKDTFSVTGLTTASTIWVSAGIGMAIGIGEYWMAGFTLVISIIVLALFEKVQGLIENFNQVRMYRINFRREYEAGRAQVEEHLKTMKVNYRLKKIIQTDDAVCFFYAISGRQNKLDAFSEFLIRTPDVKSFDE